MRYVVVEVLLLISVVLLELTNASAPSVSYEWVVSYSERSILGANKQVPLMIRLYFFENIYIRLLYIITYDYEINQQVIVINGMFPGPILTATADDVVNVNIFNHLNEPFLMTW